MTTEYKDVRISANNAPDVRFRGRLLGDFTTQNRDRTKPRWTELRLWKTEGGAWVAESVGCSDSEREVDIADVAVIDDATRAPDGFVVLPRIDGAEAESKESALHRRRIAVMAFFGWTTMAKRFAREMGWQVWRDVK
jgi:hypothetical protein